MSDTGFSGPYVTAAFLCEKLLIEAGSVPSFIRVVDRFTLPKFSEELPPGFPVPTINATLVVLLRSADIGQGKHTVTIRLQKPDFTYLPEQKHPVFFQGGDDNGAMLHLPIGLAMPDEGLFWFDVVFDDVSLLTRIPMRVLHQPAMFQQVGGGR
jgi:hypothetical protein